MATLYRRGRMWWAYTCTNGKRRRWSLGTTDEPYRSYRPYADGTSISSAAGVNAVALGLMYPLCRWPRAVDRMAAMRSDGFRASAGSTS